MLAPFWERFLEDLTHLCFDSENFINFSFFRLLDNYWVYCILPIILLLFSLRLYDPSSGPFKSVISKWVESLLLQTLVDCLRKAMQCSIKRSSFFLGFPRCIDFWFPRVWFSHVASKWCSCHETAIAMLAFELLNRAAFWLFIRLSDYFWLQLHKRIYQICFGSFTYLTLLCFLDVILCNLTTTHSLRLATNDF